MATEWIIVASGTSAGLFIFALAWLDHRRLNSSSKFDTKPGEADAETENTTTNIDPDVIDLDIVREQLASSKAAVDKASVALRGED